MNLLNFFFLIKKLFLIINYRKFYLIFLLKLIIFKPIKKLLSLKFKLKKNFIKQNQINKKKPNKL